MFYYHKGTQLNNVLLPQVYPTKQMFYNKCFTTTRVPKFYYHKVPN